MTVDTGAVVGPVIEKLMARRLGVAGVTLSIAVSVGLIEWALIDLPLRTHLTSILGPVLCAGPLLALGMRGVRRAFGDPFRPWMTLARASTLIPFLLGFWLMTMRGLRSMAVADGFGPEWIFFAAWALLGLRLLHDTSRIGEVERLAATMIVPAPGEAGAGRV